MFFNLADSISIKEFLSCHQVMFLKVLFNKKINFSFLYKNNFTLFIFDIQTIGICFLISKHFHLAIIISKV
jgi:hypothetical protein